MVQRELPGRQVYLLPEPSSALPWLGNSVPGVLAGEGPYRKAGPWGQGGVSECNAGFPCPTPKPCFGTILTLCRSHPSAPLPFESNIIVGVPPLPFYQRGCRNGAAPPVLPSCPHTQALGPRRSTPDPGHVQSPPPAPGTTLSRWAAHPG